jgi:hypothetical protein
MWNKTAAATWPPLYDHRQATGTIAGAFVRYDVVIQDGRRHLAGLFQEEGGRRRFTLILSGDLLTQWLRTLPALHQTIGLCPHRDGPRLIPNFGPRLPEGEPTRTVDLADLIPDALAKAVRAAIGEEAQAAHRDGER